MKVSYYNIGCKVNFAEISELQEKFEKLGNETVGFGEKCDAVIINTCSVTHNADADARKIIRRARRNNPDAFIGVIGCYAQLKPDEISAIEGVNAVVGTKQKFLMPEIIKKSEDKKGTFVYLDDLEELPYHSATSEDNENHTRMVFKIQDGCDYPCTYCTIPKARGYSRSMPFDALEKRIDELESSNYYEIILSGINLGDYKTANGEKFEDVCQMIASKTTKLRYRISSIEPNLLTDNIINIVNNSENFCPHFHIPLQSGSPEILKKMKRRYKAEDYSKLIQKIKAEIPDCCIGVDVISGFPGEGEAEFMETFKLLESLPVSYLHSFTYSERDFTEAHEMKGKVPQHIRKQRTVALRDLSAKKKAEFYKTQLGKIKTVIVEKADVDSGFCGAWTENYVRVQFAYKPEHVIFYEKPLKVRLLECFDDYVLAEPIIS